MGRVMTLITGVVTGAGLMWFLDPEQGERRRALLRDRLKQGLGQARESIDEVKPTSCTKTPMPDMNRDQSAHQAQAVTTAPRPETKGQPAEPQQPAAHPGPRTARETTPEASSSRQNSTGDGSKLH